MRSTNLVLSLGALSAVVTAFVVSPVSSSGVSAANQAAAPLNCDLTQYKASTGLTTALEGNVLTVSWNGQGTSQLRARFAIDGGTPTIRDLSVRRGGGEWAMLGQNLTPEYQVTTGQTPHVERPGERVCQPRHRRHPGGDRQDIAGTRSGTRRSAFRDTTLQPAGAAAAAAARRRCRPSHRRWDRAGPSPSRSQPSSRGSRGRPGYNPSPNPPGFTGGRGFGLPRTKEEIRRGVSAFSASSCEVKSDGSSLAVTFPGMKLGIFDGNLRFTVYRGTNLIQMDAIARTNEPVGRLQVRRGAEGILDGDDAHGSPGATPAAGRSSISSAGPRRRAFRAFARPTACSWPKARADRSRRSRRRTRSSSRAKWM